MGEATKIQWCDATFNPWTGCQKVSPGCDSCYAESWAKRSGVVEWGPHAARRRTSEDYWRQPLKWNRDAAATGTRPKVFCASLADVFDNQVPGEWREDLWALIHDTPHLDWLLLTKRPQNVAKMLPGTAPLNESGDHARDVWGTGWPNVWLGTTVENQEEADRRIPHLLAVPAAKRFLSCEPLLGPVDLTKAIPGTSRSPLWGGTSDGTARITDIPGLPRIDWVIAGGESGPGARPMHPDWARSLRDQCQDVGVPFHFKQWGAFVPVPVREDLPGRPQMVRAGDWLVSGEGQSHQLGPDLGSPLEGGDSVAMRLVGKKAAGALLDGREWREVPA